MEQTQQEQFIIHRIGGTTYKVRVAFSETAAETIFLQGRAQESVYAAIRSGEARI